METNGASNVGIQQKSLPNSTIVLILGIFSIGKFRIVPILSTSTLF